MMLISCTGRADITVPLLLISNERLMTPRAHRAFDRKYKTTQFDSYGARYFLATAVFHAIG